MAYDLQAPVSLDIEAGELARAHNESLDTAPRLIPPKTRHRELALRTGCLLDELRAGDPAEIRKLPYSQWLLDNGHLLRATLQQIKKSMPRRYYRQLPTVRNPAAGGRVPRVTALVDAAVSVGTYPLDFDQFERFCAAYQMVSPLTIGELWALPTMLRIRLCRHICRVTEQAAHRTKSGREATDTEELTSTIASAITSLRNISTFEWPAFVERISYVDRILQGEPLDVYRRMDFESRNDYRDVIERIARTSKYKEWDVAVAAVALADKAREQDRRKREQHVGYYLSAEGLHELYDHLRLPGRRLKAALSGHGRWRPFLYLATVLSGALALCLALAVWLLAAGTSFAITIAASVIALIPAVTLSSQVINSLVTHLRAPKRLPKLDAEHIPPAHRSVVAVPAMLASYASIDETLHTLELNYLGNSNSDLQFAMLSDYTDAGTECCADDESLLRYAVHGIERLNHRYSKGPVQPFVLLHRRRRLNEVSGLWMGWERKRGKLIEFNDLLRGAQDTDYTFSCGRLERPDEIRYVIALDADTFLPIGAAARLTATIAHPLNNAVVDPASGCVEAGFSIIQPRIETNPTSSAVTPFARLFAGDVTLDLYTHAVSDIYQDLFGRGIFAGKGIYDVDAFRASIQPHLPENRILSHDLLESLYGRAALASDVVLLEDYPTSLLAYLKRLHRWTRGDWQLLPWLFRRQPPGGTIEFRPGSVGRWQLADNMRRSLLAPAILALFSLGWLALPLNPWIFTAAVMVIPGVGSLMHALTALRTSTWRWGTTRSSLSSIGHHAGHDFSRWILTVAFLPVETLAVLDAVGRTIYRLAVSGRNLLEWTTAAEVAREFGPNAAATRYWRRLWPGPAWAGINALAVLAIQPASLPAASVLLLLWALSPDIAFRISRGEAKAEPTLTDNEQRYLRRIARDTWHFFEQNVGPATRWLPPDNVQVEPAPMVAEQTSPSNIGFALLSAASAYDLGYTGLRESVFSLQRSLDSIAQLDKYRGHLFNWYSLRDGHPLSPRYVSTVDSGNLVGALIGVRETLIDMRRAAPAPGRAVDGLLDDLSLIREQVTQHPGVRTRAADDLLRVLEQIGDDMRHSDNPCLALKAIVETHSGRLNTALLETIDAGGGNWTSEDIQELRSHVGSFSRRSASAWEELVELSPWTIRLAAVSAEAEVAWPEELLGYLADELAPSTGLEALPGRLEAVAAHLQEHLDRDETGAPTTDDWRAAAASFRQELIQAQNAIHPFLDTIDELVDTIEKLISETDFSFLYDRGRNLFHVGYRVESAELDTSYYDLLASEARLASFIAIAKGDVPPKHWVYLGRPLTSISGLRVLLSWSATAFEYLMPHLLMRTPRFGLITQSCRGAVKQQRRFARQYHIPWGVSESGYYHFDQHGRYQYQAFGIPRMGLKWDQGERLVISSYSSFLALPFDPGAVVRNAHQLEKLGGRGKFGFFEALDFGAAHHRQRPRPRIVQSYMAHHQGMTLTAISNALTGNLMVERFHRDPRVARAEYLLYERLPLRAQTHPLETFEAPLKQAEPVSVAVETWEVEPGTKSIAMLANGRLAAYVTAPGGGSIAWRGHAITRWKSHFDGIAGGSMTYIRDVDRDLLWSPGQDVRENGVTILHAPDSVETRDTRHDLMVRQQALVAPFADVFIRKLSITNDGDSPRQLFVCTYDEPVLTDARSDARHPAFSKLFIESEYLAEREALVFRRRPRSEHDPSVRMACKMIAEPGFGCVQQFETDRREFIGRRGSRVRPQALETGALPLRSPPHGSLDSVAATGLSVSIPAHETFHCAFLCSVGDDEVALLRELDRYHSLQTVDWAIEDGRRHAQHELMLHEASSADVRRAYDLLGAIVSPSMPQRDRALQMSRVQQAQAHLWRHGISGDRPVIMAVIDEAMQLTGLESLIRTLSVCRNRGMEADVVFLDESESAYSHPTQDRLRSLTRKFLRGTAANRQFETYIVPAYSLDGESRDALVVASRLIIDLRYSDWVQQLDIQHRQRPAIPRFLPQPGAPVHRDPISVVERPANLLSDNGIGGIAADSAEYSIYLGERETTPAPWCNILANPNFGTLVSESGSSCTWYENSSEFSLTTWANDPVTDRTGEALYIRDEETGLYWSPMPGPARDGLPYRIDHGAGYSRYRHNAEGLEQSTRISVDADDPVKFVRLSLCNRWPRTRRLTITYAAEWRLGNSGTDPGLHLVPDWRESDGTLFVQNRFTTLYPGACAFLTSSLPAHSVTCDGDEFLGKARSWADPPGLRAIGLSNRTGPSACPMAVYQVHVSLREGETCDLHYALGAGKDREHAARLSLAARSPDRAVASRNEQRTQWAALLDRCQVRTPDAPLDAMVNRWLPYQAIASRLYGRLGLYQASGGLGFRDQLQDALSLMNLDTEFTVQRILECASVQFGQGDVLHWWHRDPLRGVRTRCSDDLLWLPYAVARYVDVTRDVSLLDRDVPFLDALPLSDAEAERYAEFRRGEDEGSIYDHCCRAIDARMETGSHGLPLIGTGDWNDGFSHVGIGGKGESVWLAWFLIDVCRRFEPICRLRRDIVRARTYRRLRQELLRNVEAVAWAGDWYVRGFYDDGSVLGGPGQSECRIDLNAQTWAVIAGGNPERQAKALESAAALLGDDDHKVIRLLTPPFHESPQQPGYIKAYPPGVRENGGQYNHAATWAVMAAALRGDAATAMKWLSWLNPLSRSANPEDRESYRIEPYVVAGDIYSSMPWAGLGGWSWYTGAAGWTYHIVMEFLLGIRRRGSRLRIEPCLPHDWSDFSVSMTFGQAHYRLRIVEPARITRDNIVFVLNGKTLPGSSLPLESVGDFDVDVFPRDPAREPRTQEVTK